MLLLNIHTFKNNKIFQYKSVFQLLSNGNLFLYQTDKY